MTTTETTNRYEQFAPPSAMDGASTLHLLREDLTQRPPVTPEQHRDAAAMLLRHAIHETRYQGGAELSSALAQIAQVHTQMAATNHRTP
jgi:hypothetical protein